MAGAGRVWRVWRQPGAPVKWEVGNGLHARVPNARGCLPTRSSKLAGSSSAQSSSELFRARCSGPLSALCPFDSNGQQNGATMYGSANSFTVRCRRNKEHPPQPHTLLVHALRMAEPSGRLRQSERVEPGSVKSEEETGVRQRHLE